MKLIDIERDGLKPVMLKRLGSCEVEGCPSGYSCVMGICSQNETVGFDWSGIVTSLINQSGNIINAIANVKNNPNYTDAEKQSLINALNQKQSSVDNTKTMQMLGIGLGIFAVVIVGVLLFKNK